MSLPNPGMTFTPFDPLPASDLNDLVENIEAIADGSGLDDDSVTLDKTDTSTWGEVDLPAAGTTTVNVTVTHRSVIHSFATGRVTTGTATNYRIVVSTSGGTIIQQRTTQTSQDQVNRAVSATCYALVEPGTYTMTRTVSGGTFDNNTIVAMAMPAPYELNT